MRPVKTSVRLAFQDMWHFYGQRVLIGLSVAILAVVLALVATGQATLWTLWAYAIFLGGTYLICLSLRLTGVAPAMGTIAPGADFALRATSSPVGLQGAPSNASCQGSTCVRL